MLKWTRKESRKLSEHFNSTEFTCQCGVCENQMISLDLINKLETLRNQLGKPIIIVSAFRCNKHQRNLAMLFETAKGVSQHELGNAVDILLTDANRKEILNIIPLIFKAVGTAKNFVHVDLRSDKERRWDYK